MGCAIDNPCGNTLRFFVRRPDGVEVHHCLNAHPFLVGTPVEPAEPESTTPARGYSQRPCVQGRKCLGEGFIEAGRHSRAVYCLACEPAITNTRARVAARLRVLRQRCPFCAVSYRHNNGPCARHGGMNPKERKRQRDRRRPTTRAARRKPQAHQKLTFSHSASTAPHYV